MQTLSLCHLRVNTGLVSAIAQFSLLACQGRCEDALWNSGIGVSGDPG